jgi:hypothetical protein
MLWDTPKDSDPLRGAADADFVALGLGGTNMMAMLWTLAMGKRVVGVEMRGDPFLGVHWNVREDLYHQLGLIDRLMLERYGEAGIPRRPDGTLLRLASCFYDEKTVAGDVVPDLVIDGYDNEQHITGTIHHVEFIDDRWNGGVPNRIVTILPPPEPPKEPQPSKIRSDMVAVLDGPSTFQTGAAALLLLLRRYLEAIERQDLAEGRDPPRARLFTRHRAIQKPGEGLVRLDDGRVRVVIEELQELDHRGRFVRVRRPGSQPIDLGVPELFMVAEGFRSSDAVQLGFEQHDVEIDHGDGRGPVVAQADFLAGLIEVLVDGRLRRRISSEFDDEGREYWVRQIAVGHENDPEVGWVLVQVPDFKTFDPVQAGLVDASVDPDSPEFFAAYQHLVYRYYIEQAADVLEMPREELEAVQMVYGPKLFSLIERVGDDPRVAANGVIAGDSYGNGHFLTSGGAMTGMIGHSQRVLEYWQTRQAGTSVAEAIEGLAAGIREDTHAWLHVSAQEYTDALPINFGAERIAQLTEKGGLDAGARAAAIDANRRKRHSLLPLDPSDWRRLFLRNGKVHSDPLPELHAMHPALRSQKPTVKGTKVTVVQLLPSGSRSALRFVKAVLGQPGVRMALLCEDPPERLPSLVRDRVVACARVERATDPSSIIDALRSIADELGRPDMILGTTEPLQVPLGEVRDALRIPGMSADVARGIRDKSIMKERLSAAGLPVARHCVVESTEAALSFAERTGYPLVIKELEAVERLSVFRVKDEHQLRTLLGDMQVRPGAPVVCEELIEGTECALELVSLGGVPAWVCATRASASALEVLETPGLQRTIVLPRELDDPADPLVRRMGFAALRACGLGSGMFRVEWFRRLDGSVILSEIEARPSTPLLSLMSHAYDADLHRAWANAMVHGWFLPIPRVNAAGVVILRGRGEGSHITAVHGIDQVRRDLGPIIVEESLPEIGAAAALTHEGDGFIIVRHPETAEVERALAHLVSTVHVELGPGR